MELVKEYPAWLLERGEASTLEYIGVVDGLLDWTPDIEKALRLSRRKDADKLCEIVDDCWRVCGHEWPTVESVPTPSTDAREWFCINTTGDGARTFLVPAEKLNEAVHDLYCSCDKTWEACDLDTVKEALKSIANDDDWTREYPDYENSYWRDRGEDYTVTVMRLSKHQPYGEAYHAHRNQGLAEKAAREIYREFEFDTQTGQIEGWPSEKGIAAIIDRNGKQ